LEGFLTGWSGVKIALGIVAIFVLVFAAAILVSSLAQSDRHGVPRVNGELAELSAAISNYRDVYCVYPSEPGVTDSLKPNVTYNPEAYIPASAFLYRALSGDSDGNPKTPPDGQAFFEFKREHLRLPPDGSSPYIIDPWGNSYGYSTFKSKYPDSADGNNTSFDIWSTNGKKDNRDISKWVKNW
jgi:hypothetical protein